MNQYCVVVCGLQAGVADDDSAWLPVAAALKLDRADFARRVVAALPRIVRRDLDRTTAERVAQLLQAMHVDARALPDDPQLASIERAGSIRGPLPQSSLGDFIQPGESYRLHGYTAWLSWPAPVGQPAMATAIQAPVAGDNDEATTPTAASDEHFDAMPTPYAMSEVDDAEADMRPTDIDDDPPHAMPPPLPTPPTAQPPSAPEAAVDSAAAEPGMDVDEPLHDNEPFEQAQDPTPPDLDATDPLAPASAAATAPARSRTGRFVVLLLLAGLAWWAYAHWIADTRGSQAPITPAATRPAKRASGQSATPAPTASVMQAASTPTPAAAASAAASPAATSATPPSAASAPAAPGTSAVIAVPTAASSASPASSTIAPAQPAPAATTLTARPMH